MCVYMTRVTDLYCSFYKLSVDLLQFTNSIRINCHVTILVGKPEGKRPLGRTRRRCVDNIKTDLREIGWDGLDRSGSG
jgi:hypothetical protein